MTRTRSTVYIPKIILIFIDWLYTSVVYFYIGRNVRRRVFIAYIPSPMMYGRCIDSTCILWTNRCGSQGSCLIYNLELFRYIYIGTVGTQLNTQLYIISYLLLSLCSFLTDLIFDF